MIAPGVDLPSVGARVIIGTTEAVQTKRSAMRPSVSNAGNQPAGTVVAGALEAPTMNNFTTAHDILADLHGQARQIQAHRRHAQGSVSGP